MFGFVINRPSHYLLAFYVNYEKRTIVRDKCDVIHSNIFNIAPKVVYYHNNDKLMLV